MAVRVDAGVPDVDISRSSSRNYRRVSFDEATDRAIDLISECVPGVVEYDRPIAGG